MQHSPKEAPPGASNMHLLLAYVADLELEVDRLRKQCQFMHHEVRDMLRRVQVLCTDARQAENALPPPSRWSCHAMTSMIISAERSHFPRNDQDGPHPLFTMKAPTP